MTLRTMGAMLMAALVCAPAYADQLTSTLDNCTITYCFENCVLKRQVTGQSPNFCVDIPGLVTSRCDTHHASSQGGVLSVAPENATGIITRWDSTPGEVCSCNSMPSSGDISAYEVDELKPVVTGAEVVSSLDDANSPSTALIEFSVLWNGTSVHYAVTNSSMVEQIIVWDGTPIQDQLLSPGETTELLLPSPGTPQAVTRTALIIEALSGQQYAIPVTTYLPVTSVPATVSLYNGTAINLDTMVASGAVIGAIWTASLTPQPTRAPGPWIILMRSSASAGPILDLGSLLSLPSAGFSEVLVGTGNIATFFPPAHAGGGVPSNFCTSVPALPSLVAMPWFAQAIVFGDLPAGSGALDPWFSSAASGIVGTF